MSDATWPRVLPMGERALLAEVATLGDVLALRAALAASAPDGVVDIVPAARTVLVQVDPRVLPLAAARAWIARIARGRTDAGGTVAAAAPVVLDMAYDGPDLADAAAALGVSAEALAARHEAAAWTVAFAGFAPGFAYLTSDEWPFDVPRLDSPRTRVPAGSVGLAGEFTGAYPRETPGGWRLIGTTAAPLFDPAAASPALLEPGAAVRFRRVARVIRAAPGEAPAGPDETPTAPAGVPAGPDTVTPARTAAPTPAPGLRVIEPVLLATIQDLGRTGRASQGIARSGALDRGALRTANRLVGNAEGAAGIEVTLGGFRAVTGTDTWVAVTGAWGGIRIDGHAVDPYVAHAWPAGTELHIDWFAHGVRAYLAVRGGIDGLVVAGSRATDTLSKLGPAPLAAGDDVGVRADAGGPVPVGDLAPWGAPPDDEVVVELEPGPRADWFAASALATLFETAWVVTNAADRVGVRLEGSPLERAVAGEVPSEGMVPGAIQVPPSGLPTVLLADGPVTGGYPVIAVVADDSLDAFAQLRPGTRIRFRHAHHTHAHASAHASV
ncbi:MAG TPA: 5-oxoprolinase/urea amidolyase family protein [Microbacterium sp.]|uniref:5-oxoprolinase subunit B/C family protein n=1 Tax=Microbacterium sp. TaxID=51671 RepID=UPI002C774272|nr:5-oxoprolinase/urea amidolyase family protein [Microbacterium sp.]HWI31466.1 5-oxoprolinase/urea amidolyase family protein [Microbacterium sp.]